MCAVNIKRVIIMNRLSSWGSLTRWRRLELVLFSCLLILPIHMLEAQAQKKRNNIPLVRDAEIEALIKDYTAPIFTAAGLGTKNTAVYLVNKPDFNAFVSGRRMFINLGAIQIASQKPE